MPEIHRDKEACTGTLRRTMERGGMHLLIMSNARNSKRRGGACLLVTSNDVGRDQPSPHCTVHPNSASYAVMGVVSRYNDNERNFGRTLYARPLIVVVAVLSLAAAVSVVVVVRCRRFVGS